MNSLDEQVKAVAGQAARRRWDMQYPWPTITQLRLEADGKWEATFDEPDTGTEEEVTVQRTGNELHAYAWGDEKPCVWIIES